MPKKGGSRIADHIIEDYKKEKRMIAEGERRREYAKKSSMYNNGRRSMGESKEESWRTK